MSAATELSPIFDVPLPEAYRRPQRDASPGRLATVTVLHPPGVRTTAPGLRLTRRGCWALAVAVSLLAGALLLVAWRSAPRAAEARHAPAPASVTVRVGDTLWSLANRAAPARDPRAEVADLERLNHLSGPALVPGQVLRTR